ncbi:MAG TPA: hypothetical protein VG148_15890 [Pyrinomonadaceae bacterium]|nr:hypothetical protein [Pyrinomonadaceae bacterium]
MNLVRRIWLSVAGGVLIPLLYFVIAFVVVESIYGGRLAEPYGRLVAVPVGWAGMAYQRLFFPRAGDPKMIGDYGAEFILVNIAGDVLLYSLITFLVLGWRVKQRRLP